MTDYWEEEERQNLFLLLNGPEDNPTVYPFMSYTENYAENNTSNAQDKQNVVDAIASIFDEKSDSDWFKDSLPLALDFSADGIAGTIWNNPDFSTSMAENVRNAAKVANGATAALTLYFGVQEIKSQDPANPNLAVGELITAAASSVVGYSAIQALALNGSLGILLPASAAAIASTSVGAAILGAAAGYGAYKLVKHYYGDIVTAHAQGLLDTAQEVSEFVGDAMDGIEAVIEDIIDDPDFFEDFGDYVDDVATPLNDLASDALSPISQWLDDILGDIGDAKGISSPLVLDLDGDGVELTQMGGAGAVYWDIDLDGFGEDTGWITGGDGLLAIDLNADGIINDHSELFGDQTGSPNGFAALSAYDTNSDGFITSADTQFDDLLVWVDSNADGFSQDTELHTLDDLLITSIDLGYANVSYVIAGNEIKQESTFTIDGNTRDIVDAWFAYDNVNTSYAQDYTLDVRTLFLPTLRGFGTLPDLHISMSLDETLLDMVQDVSTSDMETLFTNMSGKFEDLLYRWAGVDGVSPTSRGADIDARRLEFLEELTGEEWKRNDGNPNPPINAAEMLDGAFERVLANFTSQILVQTSLKDLISENASYDFASGEIVGADAIDVFSAIEGIDIDAHDPTDDVYFYDLSSGTSRLDDNSGHDQIWFESSISLEDVRFWKTSSDHLQIFIGSEYILIDGQFSGSSDYQVELARFSDGTVVDLTKDLTFTGTDSDERLDGLDNSDDTLYGLADDDELHAGSGDDILHGGSGNDTLHGDAGNDTYFYDDGDGRDQIYEGGGTDRILLGENIDLSEVRFVRSSDDLLVYVNSDSIRVKNQFGVSPSVTQVETVELSDSTIIDITQNLTFTGTGSDERLDGLDDSDDTLYGLADDDELHAGSGDDILHGGSGNDTLHGDAGNDTYFYDDGDGRDQIYEGGGTDRILLGENIDLSEVRFVRSSDDLLVYVNSDSIRVKNQFGVSPSVTQVETVELSDSTIIDITQNLTFTGTDSDERLDGLDDSDDTLYGLADDDELNAGSGDDILHGGSGNDTLRGEADNDTYFYDDGDGFDQIYEGGGTDRILLSDNIDLSDIRFIRSSDDLIMHVNSGQVRIKNQFGVSPAVTQVETVELSDSTIIDITQNLTFTGTASDDNLYGLSNSDDTLYGLADNDDLEGDSGDDILHGGSGNDYLYGGSGSDVLYGGTGTDRLYGEGGDDIFAWLSGDLDSSSDLIQDFSLAEDDKLDVSDLLEGYDELADLITDFVEITDNGTHSFLKVDVDGGADNFVQIAQISNKTGLTDEVALETSGALITA